ncbi:glucuronate isomerase [Neomoorella humiferrea]|uniref:glucuronate isomerase n=1 Tax=Neomoorella humiferrea TaxID=676965 RepID=UPI003D92C52F
MAIINEADVAAVVARVVEEVQVTDIHTHLYPPGFGDMCLYGLDELLTYHYLVAEFFRHTSMDYHAFFQLPKERQAELVYQTLFIERSPLSEAQQGIVTVLKELGLTVDAGKELPALKEQIKAIPLTEYVDKVFAAAGVKEVVMTNDPLDGTERRWWEKVGNKDPRFKAALRLDPLLNDYEMYFGELNNMGYRVGRYLDNVTLGEIRRYLKEWAKKLAAVYMAVSLPPDFKVPEDSTRAHILEGCVIPVCRELKIPLALMIGVKRRVNPHLDLAGDSLGKADIRSIEYLCRVYPENKFLVTMLSRENQHELAVTARKFRNLMVFGCWWFLNNPEIVREITAMRLDLLGLSFIPQHSDARVLEQLIYKWKHFRRIIAGHLTTRYRELLTKGWPVTEKDIEKDVKELLGNNFWNFVGGR